jgi:hypothetical protein
MSESQRILQLINTFFPLTLWALTVSSYMLEVIPIAYFFVMTVFVALWRYILNNPRQAIKHVLDELHALIVGIFNHSVIDTKIN